MSREIGSDQTTKQRLVHTAPSQLPLPLHCMPVHQSMHACWWRGFQVQDRYRLCCWSVGGVLGALGRDPCSRCRPHKGTYSLILRCHSSLVAAPRDLAVHDACSRCRLQEATGNSSLDDTRQSSLGRRHGSHASMLRLLSRPCPVGRRCFCFSCFRRQRVCPPEWSPPGVCHDSHADRTQTHGHRTLPPSTRSTGLAGQADGDRRVCVCVGMCVERRESTCVREAWRHGT
jgi:hypothetical protein